MTQQPVTVEPPTSVAAAVTIMGMHPVGAVLVMEKGRLAGIFTERDLLRAMSYDRRFYDMEASSQPVSQWMTRNPVTVGAKASVEQAREIMVAQHFGHLPVMKGERLVGIVSMGDLWDSNSTAPRATGATAGGSH